MTNRERRAVIRAMRYIHSSEEEGGDYNAGMDILATLAGLPDYFSRLMKTTRTVTVSELASRPNNSQFMIDAAKGGTAE